MSLLISSTNYLTSPSPLHRCSRLRCFWQDIMILNVFETRGTARKVLKTHLKNVHVSKFARLLCSMIMLLSQSVICSRILCMSRLLPYANTPNSFAIRDRSMNSCEKRDSADTVVVRNAIDLSSCNWSGLSAGAILNCGSASYFQHVHLPESAENSQVSNFNQKPGYVKRTAHRRPHR